MKIRIRQGLPWPKAEKRKSLEFSFSCFNLHTLIFAYQMDKRQAVPENDSNDLLCLLYYLPFILYMQLSYILFGLLRLAFKLGKSA
jgi:hypothetical protein